MSVNQKTCKICGAKNIKLRRVEFRHRYHFYICKNCVRENGGIIQIIEVFETEDFRKVIREPAILLSKQMPISLLPTPLTNPNTNKIINKNK